MASIANRQGATAARSRREAARTQLCSTRSEPPHVGSCNQPNILKLSAVDGVGSQQLFDAQQLIVFGYPVGAAEGASLDLARVRSHCDIRDGRIFGFAGAVTNHRRIA